MVQQVGSLFLVHTSLKANFNIFYEFITKSLFADLRFVSIYLRQNKRIGENGPSLMRNIYKRFFSKIEEQRNYVKKKNRHRYNDMNSQKNKNRPMLRSKIVLILLFIRSHFVIDRSYTTIKLHISSASQLNAQKVTGQEAIKLRGLFKHIICNSFHLTITDDEYYKYFKSLLYKTSGYISYVI